MKTSQSQIENINALAELDLHGIKYEPIGDEEVRLRCPVHEKEGDHSPSVDLNIKKNLWRCHASGCGKKGDIITLLAYYMNVERQTIIVQLSARYDLEQIKEISPIVVERFHERIWGAGPLLKALYDRGLTDDDIREARIGEYDGRITIPVYDINGRIVNVRRYLPGAPGAQKFKNTAGYGKARLYQIADTKFAIVWICGGEMKARVAKRLLNPEGIGAVAVSAGEGAWDFKEFSSYFKGKQVYICMDIDHGGKTGSRMVGEQIYHAAQSIHIIKLPLDPEIYPKGDLNNYVGLEKAGVRELLDCMVNAEKFVPVELSNEPMENEPIHRVRLTDAASAKNLGKRIEVEAVVAAMDTTPYLVPKEVGVHCTKDQPGCQWCQVHPKPADPDTGYVKITVKPTSSGILEMVRAPKASQREATREALKIPQCKVAEFHVYSHYNVTDIRLSPQLNIGAESSETINPVPSFAIDSTVDLNTPYRFTGRVYPSPKDQQAVLILDTAIPVEDNLTTFAPSEADLEGLSIFQPSEWTEGALTQKLSDIYTDLEANVTRIYYRKPLHLIVDLAYHSALLFEFDGQIVKGWTNALVLGDSSQGKSETTTRLRDHYGLGEKVECKNLSRAGLLGGVQQLGNRWFVSWGVIPKHDRRLVILEEVKGTPVEVLAALTDMRSSGVAEITKIENRKAAARTRLLWISNARSDRTVSQYNFGVEAIKELIGALEDIRRFDIALVVSANEIEAKKINLLARDRPIYPHIYTGVLCRRAILWAWTRKPENIKFESAATDAILKYATELCSRFSESFPLCDRGTMRHKLARLAVALAARTYSRGETPQDILVRKCHVDYIFKFIDRTYSSSVFGYKDFSDAQIYANAVIDPPLVERFLMATKYPKDLVESLLNNDQLTENDIADWCETDRENARNVVSFLVRKHAIYRQGRSYVKTSEFISLLKRLKSADIPQPISTASERREEF